MSERCSLLPPTCPPTPAALQLAPSYGPTSICWYAAEGSEGAGVGLMECATVMTVWGATLPQHCRGNRAGTRFHSSVGT